MYLTRGPPSTRARRSWDRSGRNLAASSPAWETSQAASGAPPLLPLVSPRGLLGRPDTDCPPRAAQSRP